MDPAIIIGIVLAFGALYAMITLEGANVQAIILLPPMILVFGATIVIGLAGGTLRDFVQAWKALVPAFRGKVTPPQDTIDEVVALAEKARAEGLLALESDAIDTSDNFLRNALQNIADGTDGDELRELLEDEIHTVQTSGHKNAKFFTTLGGYAPTIGIIGTVVSLTHVLEKLSSPEKLGPLIATAFVATLWGLLSANFLWLPIGARIARINELEIDRLNLVLEGVLAVQEGAQPRLLGERLRAMVPDHQLPKQEKKAA